MWYLAVLVSLLCNASGAKGSNYTSYTSPIVNLTSCMNEVAVLSIQNLHAGGLIYLRTDTGIHKVESSFDTNGDVYIYQCSFDECGIEWFRKFVFVSQRHAIIQTAYDIHRTFICLADLVNIMPGGGATKDTDTDGIVRHVYRPEASMTFYDNNGQVLESGSFVKLGTPIDIYINLTNNLEEMFDLTVRSCSVVLLPILEDRCPVDEDLFTVFTRVSLGLWYNNFSMFRPTSMEPGPIDVLFACTLEACRNPCPTYICNGTDAIMIQNGTSRRRRQAAPPAGTTSLELGTIFRVDYEEPVVQEDENQCMDSTTLVAVFTSLGVLLIGSTVSMSYYTTEWKRGCYVDGDLKKKSDKMDNKQPPDTPVTSVTVLPGQMSKPLQSVHRRGQDLNQGSKGKTFVDLTSTAGRIDCKETLKTISNTVDKLQNCLKVNETNPLHSLEIKTSDGNVGKQTKTADVVNKQNMAMTANEQSTVDVSRNGSKVLTSILKVPGLKLATTANKPQISETQVNHSSLATQCHEQPKENLQDSSQASGFSSPGPKEVFPPPLLTRQQSYTMASSPVQSSPGINNKFANGITDKPSVASGYPSPSQDKYTMRNKYDGITGSIKTRVEGTEGIPSPTMAKHPPFPLIKQASHLSGMMVKHNQESMHNDGLARKRSASEAIAQEILLRHSRQSSIKQHTPDHVVTMGTKHRHHSQRSTTSYKSPDSPRSQGTVKPFSKSHSVVGNSHGTKPRTYSESEVSDRKRTNEQMSSSRPSSIKVKNIIK